LTGRRWFLAGIGVIVVAQILIWLVAGSTIWTFRDLMIATGSKDASDNSGFAIAAFVGAGINTIAFLAFLLRQDGWGWVLLICVQIADVVVTLAEGALVSQWWWSTSVVAAVTVALLYFHRRGRVLQPQGRGSRSC
jgi:hypothetical protein